MVNIVGMNINIYSINILISIILKLILKAINILKSLMNCEKIKSKFYIYKDERQGSRYPSSLRPHILEKFFNEHPEFNNEILFYTKLRQTC